MTKVNYLAEAELFPSRRRSARGGLGYRRFDTVAMAIKFAIEELPSEFLLGAILEVGEERFGGGDIRQLYDSNDYPLIREKQRTSMAMKTPQKSSARRNAEDLLNQTQRRESNLKLEQRRSHEAMASKTQRLRELRLAKEAAEKELTAEPSVGNSVAPKTKRSRQT